MSLTQQRTDLTNRAAAISGLIAYDHPTDSIEVPCFVVGPLDSTEYNHTFGKTKTMYRWSCRLYVSRVDMDEAMDALGSYLSVAGATSIVAALENRGTYNTASMDWTNVPECRDIAAYAIGGVDYWGAEIVVEVVAA